MAFPNGAKITSSASVSTGNIVTDVTIQRLAKLGQFEANLFIKRLAADGSLSFIAHPHLVCLVGKEASVTVKGSHSDIAITVLIKDSDTSAEGNAEVRAKITLGDEPPVSQRIFLQVPAKE